MDRNRLFKMLGAAGAAGVVATGVLVIRGERARRAYTPDEVRQRLHERAAAIVRSGEAVEESSWSSPGADQGAAQGEN